MNKTAWIIHCEEDNLVYYYSVKDDDYYCHNPKETSLLPVIFNTVAQAKKAIKKNGLDDSWKPKKVKIVMEV